MEGYQLGRNAAICRRHCGLDASSASVGPLPPEPPLHQFNTDYVHYLHVQTGSKAHIIRLSTGRRSLALPPLRRGVAACGMESESRYSITSIDTIPLANFGLPAARGTVADSTYTAGGNTNPVGGTVAHWGQCGKPSLSSSCTFFLQLVD